MPITHHPASPSPGSRAPSPASAPTPATAPLGTAFAYVALALTWGSSFLLMKVSLDTFTPAQVALGRIVIGALTLTCLMLATRRRWPRERWIWGHMTVVGILLCVIPFLLFAWAGTFLPSGLSAILNATTPIWTALITVAAVRSSRPSTGQVAGIILGALGVGLVMGAWRVFADPAFLASLPAQAACLAATCCYGVAFTWMDRFVTRRHSFDAVTIAAVQLVSAAVISLLLAPVIAATPVRVAWIPTLSLLGLGALGTGFAYVWNTRVLTSWGSLAASSVTYLTPVVGVALGMLVLGERVSWHEPVGAIVIILSILLVQRRTLPWRRR